MLAMSKLKQYAPSNDHIIKAFRGEQTIKRRNDRHKLDAVMTQRNSMFHKNINKQHCLFINLDQAFQRFMTQSTRLYLLS